MTRRVVRVPQEDLAHMLALSCQTVNQILRQFERDGLLALRYGGDTPVSDGACIDIDQ